MTAPMNIHTFYRQILATAGMVADDEGLISLQIAKTQAQPAMVSNKRLCLPLPQYLRAGAHTEHDALMLFHPLSELTSRGESKVMEYFRSRQNKKLNFLVGYLAIALLDLIIREDEHPKLSPDQVELMVKVKNVDEGTKKRLEKITEQMLIGDAERSFVHLFVRRDAKVKDVLHKRAGVATFPFYEEIVKSPPKGEENEVYGVKLRKNDRAALIALMEFIFPGIDQPSYFTRGSISHVAPTLEALMRTVATLYDPLNYVIDLYKESLPFEDLYVPSEWELVVNDLTGMLPQIRMIPNQPGNEGSDKLTSHAAPSLGTASAPSLGGSQGAQTPEERQALLDRLSPSRVQPAAPVAAAVAPAMAPRPHRTMGMPAPGVSQAPVAPPAMAAQPAMVRPQMGYPPPVQQPQGYGYQTPQPQQPVITPHGVDLRSVIDNRYGPGYGAQQPQRNPSGARSAFFNQTNRGGFGGGSGFGI